MKVVLEFDFEDDKLAYLKKDVERLLGVLRGETPSDRLWGAPFDLQSYLVATLTVIEEAQGELK